MKCLSIRLFVIASLSFICVIIFSCSLHRGSGLSEYPNTLSKKEQQEGWQLLWDGKSFDGWRGIYKKNFPVKGWIIENGELICRGNEMPDSTRGGDIVTVRKYGNFEFKCQFNMRDSANSGIKYFVNESVKSSPGHGLGLEFAILDNKNWPYDKPDYNRTCGSLYDMVRAPENAATNPVGIWNDVLIIVNGNDIEHWLNGVKTVSIEKSSPAYYQLLKKSKYANIKNWGEFPDGHILLQDEGPRISFRNIKIRELK